MAQFGFTPRLLCSAVAVALLATACSGSGEAATEGVATLNDSPGTPLGDAAAAETLEDAETEVDPETAALDFTQCLRDEGVEVTDVGVDAEGRLNLRDAFANVDRQSTEFQAALEECRPLLESAGFGQGGRAAIGDNVEIQDALVEFSQCVRDAGYDVGDVTLGGPQAGQQPGDGQSADDPEADGEAAAQRGQGQRRGFGNRNERLAERMGLDIDDPEVAATMESCAPILDAALAAAGIGAAPARG